MRYQHCESRYISLSNIPGVVRICLRIPTNNKVFLWVAQWKRIRRPHQLSPSRASPTPATPAAPAPPSKLTAVSLVLLQVFVSLAGRPIFDLLACSCRHAPIAELLRYLLMHAVLPNDRRYTNTFSPRIFFMWLIFKVAFPVRFGHTALICARTFH